MKKVSTFICFVILIVVNLKSEELSDYSIGIFTNFSLNNHIADFQKIPDCPSCSPGYRDGSGFGGAFGILGEYRLRSNMQIGLRLSYYSLSGTLKARENTSILVQGIKNNGAIEHQIDATLASFGIEPVFRYSFYDNIFLSLGLHIGTLTAKDYSQYEEIVSPKGTGTFLDDEGNNTYSRRRNEYSGELSDATSIFSSAFVGISYQLALNSNSSLVLEPELAYYIGLNNVISDDLVKTWRVNSLRGGLALKYTPQAKPEIKEQFERIQIIDTISIQSESERIAKVVIGTPRTATQTKMQDNIRLTTETISRTDTLYTPKQYNINAVIQVVSLTEDGSEEENKSLVVEDFSFNRLDPLLNYIFFDEMSSELPARYTTIKQREASDFHLDSLYNNSTIELYYNLLNIVGKRMLLYPAAKITLIGTNSDTDAEKGNIELSRKRAETIKEYLTSVWNIPQNRITIQTRNLPEKASTPINDTDKKAENRRVEIVADDNRIIEPLFIQNIHRRTTPSSIRFKLTIEADNNIKNWEITLDQPNVKQGMTISGVGQPPSTYDVHFENDTELIPYLSETLKYKIKIVDEKGLSFESSEKTLPVQIVTIDEQIASEQEYYETEKFSLILFDFDKSDITGNNLAIMDFIKKRIKPNSKVEIKGYTDRTGDEAYNLRLSQQRADATLRALGIRTATSKGLGKSELLYDNDLPEGRFYCRTVDVLVKTPLK